MTLHLFATNGPPPNQTTAENVMASKQSKGRQAPRIETPHDRRAEKTNKLAPWFARAREPTTSREGHRQGCSKNASTVASEEQNKQSKQPGRTDSEHKQPKPEKEQSRSRKGVQENDHESEANNLR